MDVPGLCIDWQNPVTRAEVYARGAGMPIITCLVKDTMYMLFEDRQGQLYYNTDDSADNELSCYPLIPSSVFAEFIAGLNLWPAHAG